MNNKVTQGVFAAVIRTSPAGPQVLLFERADGNGWNLPGGHRERGEGLVQALVREVREETGLVPGRPRRIHGSFKMSVGDRVRDTAFLYFCPLEGGAPVLNHESVGFGWFDGEHLPPIVARPCPDYPQGRTYAMIQAALRTAPSQLGKAGQRRKKFEVVSPARSQRILAQLRQFFAEVPEIALARGYGSSLFGRGSVDFDVAVMVESPWGVVNPEIYRRLQSLRFELSGRLAIDLDLVPHTEDEITDPRSPLWNPRYNPSLVAGVDLKGVLPVRSVTGRRETFSFADWAISVLLDNRTICRRQLVRGFAPEEARIFLSKLIHGPGNALTYEVCLRGRGLESCPSDVLGSFAAFDQLHGVDSQDLKRWLQRRSGEIDFEMALRLMRWYESLVALVLFGQDRRKEYQRAVSVFADF